MSYELKIGFETPLNIVSDIMSFVKVNKLTQLEYAKIYSELEKCSMFFSSNMNQFLRKTEVIEESLKQTYRLLEVLYSMLNNVPSEEKYMIYASIDKLLEYIVLLNQSIPNPINRY